MPTTKSTPKLKDLYKEKTRVKKALNRKLKAIEAISSFYNALTVDQVDAFQLVETTGQIESVHTESNEKFLDLEGQLQGLNQQIEVEYRTAKGEVKDNQNEQLRKRAFSHDCRRKSLYRCGDCPHIWRDAYSFALT